MLSNATRFLMVSAAASLVALGPAPADACSLISDGALDFVNGNVQTGSGATFLSEVQKEVFWDHEDEEIEAMVDATNMAYYWGSTSPTSEKYYDKFTDPSLAHVTLVSNASDIAAGDVLVIDKTMTYGGHTVIITGAATLISPINPIRTGTLQWAVPIADSTSSAHGCSAAYPDSRWASITTVGSTTTCTGFTSGVGTGYMRIYTDVSGALVGHTWSVAVASKTNYFPISDTAVGSGTDVGTPRPFIVGRLTPGVDENDPGYCPLPDPTP